MMNELRLLTLLKSCFAQTTFKWRLVLLMAVPLVMASQGSEEVPPNDFWEPITKENGTLGQTWMEKFQVIEEKAQDTDTPESSANLLKNIECFFGTCEKIQDISYMKKNQFEKLYYDFAKDKKDLRKKQLSCLEKKLVCKANELDSQRKNKIMGLVRETDPKEADKIVMLTACAERHDGNPVVGVELHAVRGNHVQGSDELHDHDDVEMLGHFNYDVMTIVIRMDGKDDTMFSFVPGFKLTSLGKEYFGYFERHLKEVKEIIRNGLNNDIHKDVYEAPSTKAAKIEIMLKSERIQEILEKISRIRKEIDRYWPTIEKLCSSIKMDMTHAIAGKHSKRMVRSSFVGAYFSRSQPHIAVADPERWLLGFKVNRKIDIEKRERFEKRFGLNEPLENSIHISTGMATKEKSKE